MTVPTPAGSGAAALADSPLDMIAAIRAQRLVHAERIGAACLAASRNCSSVAFADLAAVAPVLAGLDLAAGVLERLLLGDNA